MKHVPYKGLFKGRGATDYADHTHFIRYGVPSSYLSYYSHYALVNLMQHGQAPPFP